MRTIFVIAKNTFREAIRDRILYGILAFGSLFILLDIFFAKLALGDMVMIKSFGLAGIYIFGLLITIFLGASIIHKEIERRTLYFVLSKPVSRSSIILGKFFGLWLAIILTTLLMAALYIGVILFEGGGADWRGLVAILFQVIEMGLFTALLVFFSAISRPLTASISAVLLLFTGHLLPAGLENARQIGGPAYFAVAALYYILPNLEKFNLRNLAAHNLLIGPQAGLLALGYAVLYSALLLYGAKVLFERREL